MTSCQTDDLADVVTMLRERLATAEAAHVSPADAELAAIRVELDEAQSRLTANQEAEASDLRHRQAASAQRTAESEVEVAKSEINRLRAEYSTLPALIHGAEFRFHQALAALALAKQAHERNTK